MDKEKLIETLIESEALKLKPYVDSVGKLTIGVGRNLDDVGISIEEAMYLLNNDIEIAIHTAKAIIPHYEELSDARQNVVVDMAFNLGANRLMGFKKMIAALRERDFVTASEEMLDSKWARQVGERAVKLAKIMRGS
jgi:lysozyme